MTRWTLCLLAVALSANAGEPTPLIHAHAHNDYLHARPLLDALDHGFCSVEADIHLVGGKLLVAHDVLTLRPDRTLQSLYLDPLRQRIAANAGRVYRDGPTFVLLIDLKTPFDVTYPELKRVLTDYRDLLTTWTDGIRHDGALLAIITGNRTQNVIAAENPRLCACDGTLADVDTNPSPDLVPWISADWNKSFKWRARGDMSDTDRARLREIIDKAHAQKRQVRFWAAPDDPTAWELLRKAGADLINTDDLPGAQAFLLNDPAK